MSENARGGRATDDERRVFFGSDAARTYQGPARREALERGLRAEFAALQRLDTEIRERLAHKLRHRDSRTRRGDRLFGASSGARLLRTLIEMVDRPPPQGSIMT